MCIDSGMVLIYVFPFRLFSFLSVCISIHNSFLLFVSLPLLVSTSLFFRSVFIYLLSSMSVFLLSSLRFPLRARPHQIRVTLGDYVLNSEREPLHPIVFGASDIKVSESAVVIFL